MIKIKIQENKNSLGTAAKVDRKRRRKIADKLLNGLGINEDVEPDLRTKFPNQDDQLLLKQLPKDATTNPITKTFLRAGYIPVIGANLDAVVYGAGQQGTVIEVVRDGKRYAGKVAPFNNTYGHDALIEREVRKKIEEIRPQLPPEVSKHIVKCYAIFNDNDNLYYVMDIVRPMNRHEAEALFYGMSSAEPLRNKRDDPKGWPTKRDPYTMNHPRGDYADDTGFTSTYTRFSKQKIEKAFPKQAEFIKAMLYLADHFGIRWDDLHQKNVMINPKTGDYVATDIGLFHVDKKHVPKQPINGPTNKVEPKSIKPIKKGTQLVGVSTKNERPPLKEELLQEIKIDDVLTTLDSKATYKILHHFEQEYDKDQKFDRAGGFNTPGDAPIENDIKETIKVLKKKIVELIPNDLNDNQKGLCANWIKKFIFSNFDIFKQTRYFGTKWAQIPHLLETYFKIHRFIETPILKDLNLVSYTDLIGLANPDSTPMIAYKKWLEQKDYADAGKGTEVIFEDEYWKIFIPHNKGAACQLGKGTSWCTAAPGLDYYAHYHKPDDPLFIIYEKPIIQSHRDVVKDNPDMQGAIEKLQFHYGSGQFMDSNDEQIWFREGGTNVLKQVHNILLKTVGDRYPFLKDFIPTDKGLSHKYVIKTREGDISSIRYKDLASGAQYGGEYPEIEVIEYGPDENRPFWIKKYTLEWSSLEETQISGETTSVLKNSNLKGPAKILIDEYIDGKTNKIVETQLTGIVWYLDGNYIGKWRRERNKLELNYQDENMTRPSSAYDYYYDTWTNTFQQQYENQIKGREDEFAKEILEAFFPERNSNQPEQQPLQENLLKEITYEQANDTLSSKATRKRLFQINSELAPDIDYDKMAKEQPEKFEKYLKRWLYQLQYTVRENMPTDIDEKQLALSMIWFKNVCLFSPTTYDKHIGEDLNADVAHLIERFWQTKDFIEPKEYQDLNKIKTIDEMRNLVNNAKPKYQAYIEKQNNANWEKGAEFLGENEYFKVYIPHSKAAACHLGKGTDWCTAAPGLDYFAHYYKQEDPLFIFIAQQPGDKFLEPIGFTSANSPASVQKFQFHYGSTQFMDFFDEPVNRREFVYLDNLLKQVAPDIDARFPAVRAFHREQENYNQYGSNG